MVGLSLSELSPEELHAGDKIAYYSWAFVTGDPRGYRESVVLRVDSSTTEGTPIQVDTGEVVPLTMKLKRLVDHTGHHCTGEEAKWRNLRTFRLVDGTYDAPMRSSAFNRAVQDAIADAFAYPRRLGGQEREDLVENAATGSALLAEQTGNDVSMTSTSVALVPTVAAYDAVVSTAEPPAACEHSAITRVCVDVDDEKAGEAEEAPSIPNPAIVPMYSGGDASAVGIAAGEREETPINPPTDMELVAVKDYLKSVPTRLERAKIRNQPKLRPAGWHVPRSRKRRDQKKCGITRSGTNIYHAHTIKAKKAKAMLRLPGIKARLRALHVRRPVFVAPSAPADPVDAEVPWPAHVKYTEECEVPEGIAFADIGMEIHARRLCEYAAIVEGQPAEAIKQNSGYTMLLHERSVNGHFVYIEALKCGSTTRFLSHACDPNVAFFEMQNRTTVKVLAVMIKTVKAGTQLTVNYGKKVWFKCACDDCWVEPTGEEE
ncbi:hypothetical protein PF004_g6694 [Phytophthora fragariae]|uniref:SET domain-containing protein n=3 Tax=Phytophthora TaxID=4783 RepID=A0A6G0PBU1_9STRA|nr:hypothetical protein PF004_g6694 [Phytophthora fragariae]